MGRTYVAGDDFSLHTRPSAKGPVFYAQFRTEGGWTTAKSTRILDTGKRKDYQAAVAWCQQYLDSGQVVRKERLTFQAFAKGFFDWEGDWAKDKVLRGRRLSREQCYKHALNVKNHLLPYFGEMKISAIEDEDVSRWQRKMKDDGLSGATINRTTVALRLILKAAYRQKLLRRIPVVEAVAENSQERGIFTPQEILSLFERPWPDRRYFAANLLAAVTGMRASEIVALREQHLHPDYIEIVQKWSPKYGLGPTKTGKPRIVTIPARVYRELRELLAENPHPPGSDRFIFYGVDPGRPIDQQTVTDALYRALKQIGIDNAERKRRRLVFHSWRHGFNTMLIQAKVQTQIIQSVTGHLTDAMTQHYYHASTEGLAVVRKIQEAILEPPKKKNARQSVQKNG